MKHPEIGPDLLAELTRKGANDLARPVASLPAGVAVHVAVASSGFIVAIARAFFMTAH
jgi:hypothetical protein